tara:strand:+ start:293 stop:541 length:249 start_codon:yes stop_codon:yes gene_type:complete
MSWKDIVKEFDEHGRDFDEQGLDGDGKPIPKKDEFLEEMKDLISEYEKYSKPNSAINTHKMQLRVIKEMLRECQDELKEWGE